MKYSIRLVNTLARLILVGALISSVSALYEDQIGKFDW